MRWRECVDPGLMPRAGTDTLTTPPARPGVTCASPQDGAVGPGASGDTLTGKERNLRHSQKTRRSDRPLSPPDFGRDFPDPEGMSPDKAQPLLPVLLASELPRPRPRRPASTKRRNPPLSHFEVFELPPFDPSSTPGQAAFLATHADTENVDLNVSISLAGALAVEPVMAGSSVTPGEMESQTCKERAHGIVPLKDGASDRSLRRTDTLMKYYNVLYVVLMEV